MKSKESIIKKIIIFILGIIVNIAYCLTSKRYRENGDSYISTLRNIIYSLWIGHRLGVNDIKCGFPTNTIRGCKYIYIGKNVTIGKYAVITAWDKYGTQRYTPQITIGDNCNFGDYIHLTCINKIEIGNNVLTGRWVTISDNAHGESSLDNMKISPEIRPVISKGKVIIKQNVWIGDKVTILSGVTIGEGCIIGANSVVTKDIPPYSVVAGIPAKILKQIY